MTDMKLKIKKATSEKRIDALTSSEYRARTKHYLNENRPKEKEGQFQGSNRSPAERRGFPEASKVDESFGS